MRYLSEMIIDRTLGKEIFWHALFWLLYLLIRVFIIQLYPGPFGHRLLAELIEVPLKAAALYFAIYVLVKNLLLSKRYLLFVLALTAYIVAVMLLNRIEDYFFIFPLTQSATTKYEMGFWNIQAAFLNLIYIYPVVGLGVAVYFVKSWYQNQLNQERLLNDKMQAEMKLLKDQLHPHFLFNTLNNIYSLAQARRDETPEMMLRLSKLLSFMLYDCNAPFILISKEIQALSDYIELERLRLGKRLELTLNVSGEVDRKSIAPLILFPFVENCFKHGSHKTVDSVWIIIDVIVNENKLNVRIENALVESGTETGHKTGIGIDNVKRRLSYLYPSRHILEIEKKDTFLVKLEVMLT